PLEAEDDVRVRFVERAGEVGEPDLIVLPGTKTTIADLRFLRERGLDKVIAGLAGAGTPVLGICGGYQMLGNMILDPLHVEAAEDHAEGLGLLPVTTTFREEKRTVRATGHI